MTEKTMEEQLQEMIDEADRDGVGKGDVEEFLRIMKKQKELTDEQKQETQGCSSALRAPSPTGATALSCLSEEARALGQRARILAWLYDAQLSEKQMESLIVLCLYFGVFELGRCTKASARGRSEVTSL